MSSRKRRKMTLSQRIATGLGVGILAVLILSFAAPFLPNLALTNAQDPAAPTAAPAATTDPAAAAATAAAESTIVFPTPVEGTPVIDGAGTYIHPTGAFTLFFPQGWTTQVRSNEITASVTFNNADLFSVIHAYVEDTGSEQDLDSLDALYDAERLAATWTEYDDWLETARDVVDGRVQIDFDLIENGMNYRGRHITWPAEAAPNWSQVLRIVAPGNNPALLDALTETLVPTFQPVLETLESSLLWSPYIDQRFGYLVKFAESWTIIDGEEGRVTTIADETQNATLTVAADAETAIEDEAAAEAWVTTLRASAEIVTVEEAARTNGQGYAVAYTYTIPDGAERSGLALLLNGADGRLVSANLVVDEPGLNLLESTNPLATAGRSMLQTFALLPEGILPDPDGGIQS